MIHAPAKSRNKINLLDIEEIQDSSLLSGRRIADSLNNKYLILLSAAESINQEFQSMTILAIKLYPRPLTVFIGVS